MAGAVDIVTVFRDAARQVAARNVDSLTLASRLSDLGVDSASIMEMIGLVEEQLRVHFDDEALAQVTTLGELARLAEGSRARAAATGSP